MVGYGSAGLRAVHSALGVNTHCTSMYVRAVYTCWLYICNWRIALRMARRADVVQYARLCCSRGWHYNTVGSAREGGHNAAHTGIRMHICMGKVLPRGVEYRV